jgi:hypothetical protein
VQHVDEHPAFRSPIQVLLAYPVKENQHFEDIAIRMCRL